MTQRRLRWCASGRTGSVDDPSPPAATAWHGARRRPRDADRVRENGRIREAGEKRLQHVSHGGLADPAQGQAGESYAELHSGDELVEALMELLDSAGPDAVGGNELLQPGFADANQRELGRHKERIRRYQQNHRREAQHHERKHEAEILPSAGGSSDGRSQRCCPVRRMQDKKACYGD